MVDRPLSPYLQNVTLLLALISLSTFAQEPYLEFGRVDGDRAVTNVDIVDIAQDSHGFLWFATRGHGLVRYDGYDFRVFGSEPGNPHSLSHNDVARIDIDVDGKMWVSTASGTNIYDPASESFTLLVNDPMAYGLSGGYVNATAIDGSGTLWIAEGGGLLRKDKDSESFRSYLVQPDQPGGYLPYMAEFVLVD
jgi:ligand-binding sensor domain-containing protein